MPGQVAVTRCGQAQQTASVGAAAFTGRVAYTSGPTATADLRFCFSNWVTMLNWSESEAPMGQSCTIKAAIEIPQGGGTASFPIWFAGQRSAALDDGAEIWSDPVGVEVPASTMFWVRVLYTAGGSGTQYPQANIYSTADDSWQSGDSVDGSGALSSENIGQGLYRPTVISGTPVERAPQVIIIGDERAMGNSAAPVSVSYFDIAFNGAYVSVNLGTDQDRASWFTTDHAYRGRFIAGCDYAIETYGGKDLDDSDGLDRDPGLADRDLGALQTAWAGGVRGHGSAVHDIHRRLDDHHQSDQGLGSERAGARTAEPVGAGRGADGQRRRRDPGHLRRGAGRRCKSPARGHDR